MGNKGSIYGGQAVIEGVMMGGKTTTITAIRRKDGSIQYFEVPREAHPRLDRFKKWPFVRGIIGIIESSVLGTKHLNFSSEKFDKLPEDDVEAPPKEEERKWGMILGVTAIAILSFLFGKFIFTLVPAFLAQTLIHYFPGRVTQVLIEGAFKILLLLGYVYFVSLTPLMKRVFQYHGAEHKVINAYENGMPLTIENVQEQTRLHYRCGSSFILFTAVISIFLYLFLPVDNLGIRVLTRILLIPVDLGLSYEVLRATNAVRNIPYLRALGYPGLWLQLLTTKEPDAEQIEIAIAAFNEMKEKESENLSHHQKSILG